MQITSIQEIDVFAPSAPLLLCTEDEFREQNMRT